ncbi:MAG: hypothetical protein COZ06_28410 [Armatimonadetes bacterium CG_4_10_14_3_um_filter_66_18]|nr:alcohol dehydrogenase catalytic domain-containing protein [Armatimonadota bacterium]OIO95575.1 MAG: hypothetical protein AUJ96_26515 [Armatimonadetes bacterium CG2_30_66_41]PIU95119.1 MAG: hypothetical protein COS65_04055 [Armatimonadetes bacterium CG06_land_8_20_14_3_00_66_21]PIX41432.1 MAG: hypothetical protein COZ57_23385 [Armatimonadetes bacterium CG_4_8_14_3_um_filter_66_20]PIY40199.1 MAG: hypothetical protein COZ06_28410 [Armatimonadetes bacterium CG_4_10_14_3_um_filter_66_18]PIZ30255
MKAAVVESKGTLVVRDVPNPRLEEYTALVRIIACSICNGTDHKLMTGKFPGLLDAIYPTILGHESVGTVIKCGKKVRNYQAGDVVLRPQAHVDGINSHWGGLAQFGVVVDSRAAEEDGVAVANAGIGPKQQVVPPDIDPLYATQLITYKEIWSYLKKLDVQPTDRVIILGTGPVGLTFLNFVKNVIKSYEVYIVGRRELGMKQARIWGADRRVDTRRQLMDQGPTEGFFQVVIDCAGTEEMNRFGISSLHWETAKYAPYALWDTDAPAIEELRTDPRVVEFGPSEEDVHEEVLQMVRDDILDLSALITHVFPLDRIQEGFDLLEAREAHKVIITPN